MDRLLAALYRYVPLSQGRKAPTRASAGPVWIDEEGQVSPAAADAFFASLADRTPAQA
jgi:hypothetical protein